MTGKAGQIGRKEEFQLGYPDFYSDGNSRKSSVKRTRDTVFFYMGRVRRMEVLLVWGLLLLT